VSEARTDITPMWLDLSYDVYDRLRFASQEIERLQEIIGNPEVGIRKLLAEDGQVKIDFTAPPFIIQLMAQSLLGMLDGAPNYTEAQIIAGATDGKQYVMRVERFEGKTPHALRKEAEEERDRLRKLLDECQYREGVVGGEREQ
jgi:hypothetical protein